MIDKMTPEEKSVILARLCGWTIDSIGDVYDTNGQQIHEQELGESWYGNQRASLDFYNPSNMALLAKVIEWACSQDYIPGGLRYQYDLNFEYGCIDRYIDYKNIHVSMCKIADEILLSAIEAGRVK